ncbi:hypothetical protein Acsp04_54520 [Actinomadura sp. NBRC 104425]|uniref:putative quinol monooxygenase n=1 Tax=Actinomadura sp. NBRC 104425 TaxID=3032204 RepID=UPI00249FA116|nr:antibiotic biosynthesis monooxygenase [Actinomadura sp. NBRC 104425]GLZ15217.1 hypothetical protein Acsp04_54520 [Actinomadura sp. NBRC 104425]
MATGLLISRASKDRSLYLIAWSVTMVGLSLALAAMAIGFLLGWAGPLFRVSELGAALLAPVWLALGMIELIARVVQVRFAAWLFAVSYSVVATVILLVDPLRGSFSKALPKPRDTYDAIPLLLVDGAHVVAVVALVACAAFTAVLASKQDREAGELLIPVALVALAGVLVVSGSRGLLPAPLAVLALGAAAGLVWYGATRTIPVYADDEAYDGEEPATGYDDEGYDEEGYGDRGYADQPYSAAAAEQAPAAGAAPPAGKRGELRFPEQQVEEVRFPEQPSPSSTVDDAVAAAAAGAAGAASGREASTACGQITVYTLLDGREEAFDRLADELVQAAIAAEPDTVIFACHQVVGAPTQRIFYQLFRDEAAFAAHRGQPHLRRFMAESRTHVLATNVIEVRLGSAKLPPLPQSRPPSAHGVPDFP